MKTSIKLSLFLLLIPCFMSFAAITNADPPAPPEGGHGQSGNQQGAPIDGGISILTLMGAGYMAWKRYKRK